MSKEIVIRHFDILNMHVSVDEHKTEIDVTDIQNELNDWIEGIYKTVNEICDDPDRKRIKLKMSDNEQQTGFIIELMTLEETLMQYHIN